MTADVRAIAFYLPQFHPIPLNDRFWGKGFTEWTNVARARPLFRGHYQPHLPGALGFYDLRLPETRVAQADLARDHGISAFCYYHYWFNGEQVLERPFKEVLASGEPDFPFCLCWANENWTKAWDGKDKDVLLEQRYSLEDDRTHIRSLLPAFADRRYVRVKGRPLFLVYRASMLPNPAATAALWRDEARAAGVGDLYLAKVENFKTELGDPHAWGFDAAVEFQPDARNVGPPARRSRVWQLATRAGLSSAAFRENKIFDYATLVQRMLAKPAPGYRRFPCVVPSWDNTARRMVNATVLHGSTPELYESWLRPVVERAGAQGEHERLLFINAWNEWAEGCHLEPDERWGHGYLEATQRCLDRR